MRRCAAVLVMAVSAGVAAACGDLGPESGRVAVVFAPSFATMDAGADENPALRVDNIRILVTGAAGDTLVDQVVVWPLDQDTLRAEVAVEVAGTQTFQYRIEGREGETVLFSAGPFEVVLTGGSSEPVVVRPELVYAGAETSLVAVAITGAPQGLAAGGTVDLAVAGTDEGGAQVEEPLVAWSSLDTAVAVVDGDGVVTARVVASRTARIVARVLFRELADTVEIPVHPAAVAIEPGRDTLNALGFTLRRVASATGPGGVPLAAGYAWTSRDPAVVRVAEERGDTVVLMAMTPGSAWVVAGSGSAVDSVAITVRQVVSAVAVLPTRVFFAIGDTLRLAPLAVDSAGSLVPASAFAWSSGSPAATVDATGLVTGAAGGTAAVAATFEGVTGSARFEVGGSPTAAVAVGDAHACRLDAAGAAWCWGSNDVGQLGDGTTTARQDPVPVAQGSRVFTALAAGGDHTCALATDGSAWCWGGNASGQLGDGAQLDRMAPVAVTGGLAFTDISAGGRHSCGLTAAGAAYCWGLDGSGQLGDGTAGGDAATPQAVAGGLAFDALVTGWLHTCGLTAAGAAHCWGRGLEGQLGGGFAADTALPTPVAGGNTFVTLAAGPGHTCGVTAAGSSLCWGYNSSGQLGTGSAGGTLAPAAVSGSPAFAAMAAGWVHSCGLEASGAVSCWGANAALELGAGSPRATRVPLAYASSLAFDELVAGGRRTCGTAAGVLVCWGGVDPELLGRGSLLSPGLARAGGTSATR